jgi:hypothetical protein
LKFKEINIIQFKSINELYSFIDDNSFELQRDYELSDIWVRYKNHSNIKLEKKKSQWEIDCFNFDLKSNILFSQIYSEGKNISEIDKYPDLNEFNIEVVKYIESRISNTKSPILRAKYNHLLWKCPTGIKKTKYALNAIKNYISSIKECIILYKKNDNKDIPFQIGQLFENLVSISNEIKFDKTELKSLTKLLLFDTKDLEFYIRHNILTDMLKYPKIYKALDFENTLDLFENELKSKTSIDDFLLSEEYLSTAIIIAKKTKKDYKKYHNQRGFSYLRLAETIIDKDRYWIKQSNYAKAITEFKLSKNIQERNRTEKLYSDLKPLIKLPTISIPFTEDVREKLKKHNDNLKNKAKKLLKFEPDYIYRFISSGLFFPDYESTIYASKKSNSYLNYLTTISFDNNKNITKERGENKELRNIYEFYKNQLQETILPYLHYIIILGIESGILTFKNFISFLSERTWIGKTHIRYDLGGKEQEINWIEHLSPSIIEFFLQVQAWCSSKYYKPSFILCTDSFTLKMEGIFRNFCERAGIPTSSDKEKGMQEIYLNNVFDNEIIINYFDENDRLFFNYLFSNDGGLNLRNNIAHCFYNTKDYHPDKMLLLIAALLRLGKYNHKKI